jgi:hypothetical protein
MNIMKGNLPSPLLLLLSILLTGRLALIQGLNCVSSEDCDGTTEYCADGECLVKGDCKLEVDCFNPKNDFAVDDCIGYLECQEGACGKVCSDQNCKPDKQEVNCFANPCEVTECSVATNCVSNYCDGCNAFYFDTKGTQVCTTNLPKDPTPCSMNADCTADSGGDGDGTLAMVEESPYCAAGVCLEPGSCNTEFDCINPSNNYPLIECVGPIVCQDGLCTRDCTTGSLCPEGVEVTNCFADPCTATGCEGSVSCFSDYCGGCNAIHFYASGSKIECDTATSTTCKNDLECGEEHFCASGKCMESGECQTTEDCLNPSNIFGSVDCTGYLECSANGECAKICSTEEHCCFIEACSASARDACSTTVSCVTDNCNEEGDHCGLGKGVLQFDAAGNEVCSLPITCINDADCVPTQTQRSVIDTPFCAQGRCRSAGACKTDLDCINPSNVYDIIECQGYIRCGEDGTCGVKCGTMCASGEDYTTCETTPCMASAEDGQMSCVNDYCGGCNAIRFDAAGYPIESSEAPRTMNGILAITCLSQLLMFMIY